VPAAEVIFKKFNKNKLNKSIVNSMLFLKKRGNMLAQKIHDVLAPPIEIKKNPIVNLCEPKIESVFFQHDSASNTKGDLTFNNPVNGNVVKFIYYLDSSAGDSVTINIYKVGQNLKQENLLVYAQNSNNYIKGTFNNTVLTFNLNTTIKSQDKIIIHFENNSSNDVTIMASLDIKYEEGEFIGTNN
jgi:hypothetical protein